MDIRNKLAQLILRGLNCQCCLPSLGEKLQMHKIKMFVVEFKELSVLHSSIRAYLIKRTALVY